jgi:hypothetical protein
MPKRVPPLSEEKIMNARPRLNSYKLHDGGGLFLLVSPSGGKVWRISYYLNEKRKDMTLGKYPDVSLLDARRQLEDAKNLLASDIDPGEVKKERKAERQHMMISPRVSICMDGIVEVWKGQHVIRFTKEEAIFVKDQLTLLT